MTETRLAGIAITFFGVCYFSREGAIFLGSSISTSEWQRLRGMLGQGKQKLGDCPTIFSGHHTNLSGHLLE